jgi:hypothetical protein
MPTATAAAFGLEKWKSEGERERKRGKGVGDKEFFEGEEGSDRLAQPQTKERHVMHSCSGRNPAHHCTDNGERRTA